MQTNANTPVDTLKEELSAVELEQRFEMVQTTAADIVDITNFICSPAEQEAK